MSKRLFGRILLVVSFTCVCGELGAELRYARNFSIEAFATHKEVRVRDTWTGAGESEQVYALVPRGAAMPSLSEGARVVRVPVRRLVAMGTVYLGPVEDLGLWDSLVGISYLDYASNPKARQRVESGAAKEIPEGMAADVETLLLLQPDLILTSTAGSPTFDGHSQMLRAGLPVVVTAGYMEEHPLARAEWIKFIAAFFGKETEAEQTFDEVAERYEELVALTSGIRERPTVFASAPYGGVWHVPGGRSYMATALSHAGADYLWQGVDSRGGVPLDFEVILRQAAEADYWLNPSHFTTRRALLSLDERFVGFRAFREGRVFNKTLRVNKAGGNDIFERGVSRPDEVLADLIKIFHPELVPEHAFVFYEKLE